MVCQQLFHIGDEVCSTKRAMCILHRCLFVDNAEVALLR